MLIGTCSCSTIWAWASWYLAYVVPSTCSPWLRFRIRNRHLCIYFRLPLDTESPSDGFAVGSTFFYQRQMWLSMFRPSFCILGNLNTRAKCCFHQLQRSASVSWEILHRCGQFLSLPPWLTFCEFLTLGCYGWPFVHQRFSNSEVTCNYVINLKSIVKLWILPKFISSFW